MKACNFFFLILTDYKANTRNCDFQKLFAALGAYALRVVKIQQHVKEGPARERENYCEFHKAKDQHGVEAPKIRVRQEATKEGEEKDSSYEVCHYVC